VPLISPAELTFLAYMDQRRSFWNVRVGRSVTTALAGLLAALSVGTALAACTPVQQQSANGTVQRVTVHSKALEGNLEGDSPVRDVSIYLPPRYSADQDLRYPVLYMLHGYTETDLSYFGVGTSTNIPSIADRTLANGTARDMIIVTPNAMTVYGGSNYSSGATTGDWETFVSDELVSYIDTNFRTIASRGDAASRATPWAATARCGSA
jgi:S-formylglutathione hydrolase